MIEPVASHIPWDVIPGNHDIRNGDSGGECGLPMLARFETPFSQAAWPLLSAFSNVERCATSFDFAEGNPMPKSKNLLTTPPDCFSHLWGLSKRDKI
eukprot:UN08617